MLASGVLRIREPIPVPEPKRAHLGLFHSRLHRSAWLWKIERTDGVIKRFTSHDQNIEFIEELGGALQTYTPEDGMESTAIQRDDSLRAIHAEYVGVISSSAISDQDLYAGLYRKAKITAYVVDWRYPFAGALRTQVFFAQSTKFDGVMWSAQVDSLTKNLQLEVGRKVTRTCQNKLGDGADGGAGYCTVDIENEGPSGQILKFVGADVHTVVDRQNLQVDSTGLTTEFIGITPAGFFEDGYIEWTTGLNAGHSSPIAVSAVHAGNSRRQDIELFMPTPFDITVGDLLTIRAGCNRTFAECHDKFTNRLQFRGFPHAPGLKRAMVSPDKG